MADHIFSVTCPTCERTGYYDKRQEARNVIRWRESANVISSTPPASTFATGCANAPSMVCVRCDHCDAENTVEVDFAGYI